MPSSAGTTSELYLEQDKSGSTLGAPPSAPAPVPPPTTPQAAAPPPPENKRRMQDQNPDGTIRDTSTEALGPGKDLRFRNITDEENAAKQQKPPEVAPPVEVKPEEAKQPVAENAPVSEKVYAGKFKSVEELEKSYEEAQKLITRQGQEKAELARKAAEQPAPAPPPKTPAQIAAEEAEKNKFLADFVADPQKVISDFQQKAILQTQIALTSQQVTNEWKKNNPDLVEHEYFVGAEAQRLMQTDPELAKDPAALITKATDNFRQIAGKLRTQGAKEALTQETRVIPLLQNTAPSAATEQPKQAPLSSDDAYALTMKMLKEQEQRSHRGLRR